MAEFKTSTRECPSCKRHFSRSGFPARRSHSSPDTFCIACDAPYREAVRLAWLVVRRERRRARKAADPQHAREVMLAYEAKRKRDPKKAREYSNRSQAKDPLRTAAWAKRSKQRRSEQNSEWNKAWKQANKEKVRKHGADRRARLLGARQGGWSVKDVRDKHTLQKGRCALCRDMLGATYHRDHIMPLARGGEHTGRNMQLLCAPCNRSKGARHPLDYSRSLGLLL
jgi:5-methylcytosine-specific restriction endonuclease McrA